MLDARQLDALAAVIEHGSFGAASQALNITLAAVSLRIKSLEAGMGQRLLVRGKQVRPTPAGQALLGHVRRVRLMEADLLDGSARVPGDQKSWQSLSVAVNADSLCSWFLPGVAAALHRHQLLLDTVIEDQDHTHKSLSNGDVTGCVTTLAPAIRGCVAEPLGVMRYRCVASPDFIARWGGDADAPSGRSASPHDLLRGPVVIFNRKDTLQDAFLAQHCQLRNAVYPRHFVPAVDAFEAAIELGMGWGMMSELHLAARAHRPPLQDVMPGCTVDVMLYWQHWSREAAAAQRLTQAVKEAALQRLRPAPAP
jgi:LysR family transcriptional regulator, chromosome initiation inhibitor